MRACIASVLVFVLIPALVREHEPWHAPLVKWDAAIYIYINIESLYIWALYTGTPYIAALLERRRLPGFSGWLRVLDVFLVSFVNLLRIPSKARRSPWYAHVNSYISMFIVW